MDSRLKTKAVFTAVGLAAISIVAGFEGLRTHAYRDSVGIPTICFGETRGVHMGQTYTAEQCKTMLGDGLVEFEQSMRRCLKSPDSIPDGPYEAFLSLSYNIGASAFCGSSVAREANAGNLPAACEDIMAWDKASGRVLQGLVNRRTEERDICRKGLPK